MSKGYLGIGRTLFCALRLIIKRASMVPVNAESEYLSNAGGSNDASKINERTM